MDPPARRNSYEVVSEEADTDTRELNHLRIKRLNRLTFLVFRAGASFFSLPLYVGLKELQGMVMVVRPSLHSFCSLEIWKSYSYETVDCSRPLSGSFGFTSSLTVNEYFLAVHR